MTGPRKAARRRGAVYTPEPVVEFLVDWALADGGRRVLEPSAGDGRFVSALCRHDGVSIDAVEIDPEAAGQIRSLGIPGATVHTADALSWYQPLFADHGYDAVVGNPPFVGYHGFRGVSRGEGLALLRAEGIESSAMVNAWVPFVALACRVLRRGGRLAMVLPGELLYADYAEPLRRYLTRRLARMCVVTFRRLLFEGVAQDALLLLGVAGGGTERAAVSFVEVETPSELHLVDAGLVGQSVEADPGASWSSLRVPEYERALLERVVADLLVPLFHLASIDVGIVTGANEFFCLGADQVAARHLWASAVPLAPRPVPGIVLDKERWLRAVAQGRPCYLFSPGAGARSQLSAAALAYVAEAEARGVHRGYKCSLRLPAWWRLPLRPAPGAFFPRNVEAGPRMIVNATEVVSVDSFMSVRPRPGVDVAGLAAGLHNSATYAIAELTWHAFGGGVLNVGPGMAELLPVPAGRVGVDPERVDALVTDGDVDATLRFVDDEVLVAQGVSRVDAGRLRQVVHEVRRRRLGRR